MPSSRSVALTAIMLTVASLLAGCAGDPSRASQSPPAIGAVSQISDPTQVERPIDTYVVSAEGIVDILGVERSLIARCLQRTDGTFDEAAWATPGREQLRAYFQALLGDDTRRSDLWGFFDPENASRGYARADPSLEVLEYASPPGVSEDLVRACSAEAHEDLPGKAAPIELMGMRSLPDGGPSVPLTDARYVAAVTQWSDCMRSAGFDYEDPLTAIAEQTARPWTDRQAQATIASKDVRCKIDTNLVGIGTALQAAYDQQYIDAHRAELEVRQDAIESYLRKAGAAGR